MEAERRAEWVCAGCGVRVYKPGAKMAAPRGWQTDSERCLRCQDDEEPRERAKRLLLDGASIRKAAKLSPPLKQTEVSKLRDELVAAGELDPDATPDPEPDPPKPKERKKTERKSPASSRAEAELRADPSRSNKEIAKAIGISSTTVWGARRKMGITSPKLDGHGNAVR
jgi:winged helix-turn-helix DNA-binding protein